MEQNINSFVGQVDSVFFVIIIGFLIVFPIMVFGQIIINNYRGKRNNPITFVGHVLVYLIFLYLAYNFLSLDNKPADNKREDVSIAAPIMIESSQGTPTSTALGIKKLAPMGK